MPTGLNCSMPSGHRVSGGRRGSSPTVPAGIRQAFIDEFDETQLKLLGIDFEVLGWIRRSVLS